MQYKKRQLLMGAGAAAAGSLFPAAKLFALPILTATDIDPALIAEPDPVNFTGAVVPVSQFGILAQADTDTSVSGDYYTKMQAAIAYAKANNVSLQFGPGRYNFAGPTNNTAGMFSGLTCSIIGVPGQTQIYLMNSGGLNVRWDWAANAKDIVVSGLTFNVVGTPTSATNDATENCTVLRFTSADNVRLDQLTFNDPYGGAVLFRNVTNSAVTYCNAIGCYKDSFHCTGTSQNIIYYKCKVIDGGDDGFAVVGYAVKGNGGGTGQPTNIRHVYCEVYGVKFARCMSYVGSLNCINVGAIIDGQIPTYRASSALYPYGGGGKDHHQGGILIAAEVVVIANDPTKNYSCYGNQNLIIRDFQMKNCGSGGLFPIQIYNKSTMTSDNIQLVNGIISRSGKTAIVCGASTATYCTNVLFQDLEINDTTNPNGVWINIATQGVPGEGANGGFALAYLRDFAIKNCTANRTGANQVVNIGATCQGAADIDLITIDINPKGYAGQSILNFDSSATTQMSEVNFKLFMKKQGPDSVPASGQYFFERVVNTNSKSANTLSIDITHFMSMSKGTPLAGVTAQSPEQPDTGSPRTVTNISSQRRLYNVYNGTVSTGANAPQHIKTDANGNTVTTVESASKGPGLYTLEPGESLKLYYTSAPTITWYPVTGL